MLFSYTNNGEIMMIIISIMVLEVEYAKLSKCLFCIMYRMNHRRNMELMIQMFCFPLII